MTRAKLPDNERQLNRCIRADDQTHARAAKIGGGYASKGYRLAVAAFPLEVIGKGIRKRKEDRKRLTNVSETTLED